MISVCVYIIMYIIVYYLHLITYGYMQCIYPHLYPFYIHAWLVNDPEVYLCGQSCHSLFLSFLRARIASTAPLTCASQKNLLVLINSWRLDNYAFNTPLFGLKLQSFFTSLLLLSVSLCVCVCDKPLGTGIKRDVHKTQGAIGCHRLP